MWTPENADFSKNAASTFLLSAWHELFYGFTPDSYQPRLHNVASLIEELVDISRHWLREPRFQTHIGVIKAELKSAIESEDVFLSAIPPYRTRVHALVDAKTPEAIIAGGTLLAEERPTYWDAFQKYAIAVIDNLPRHKRDALTVIRRLATFAFQQGKENDDVWEPVTKHTDLPPSAIFRELVELTRQGDQDYTCTLSILGDIQGMHSIARRQGYTIVARDSLPDHYADQIPSPGDRTLHVQKDIRGRSVRSAVAEARKNLSADLGFVSLYTNPSTLRLHSSAIVSHNGQNRVFVQVEQAFRRLYPRSNAKRDIKEAIDLITAHTVDRRILAAVEQLALASASTDTRTRFVNLWSSIETLAGVHEGKTTLERVHDLIVPLVISRNVHRTTRYITILTQRFGQQIGSCDFGAGFRETPRGVLRLDDMLTTLTSQYGDRKIVDLLKFAKHPLLRFRVFGAWETFHDPRALAANLRASRDRLEWQITRIYRARNLLVHEGEEVPFIVPLLDNLQTYLSTLVQRLIHELKSHSTWHVRNLIEYWRGRMRHTIDALDRSPSCLTTRDFLECGDPMVLWPA